jgi:lipopolysaccharide export system protein LptA
LIATLVLAAALAAPHSLASLPAAGGGTITVSAKEFRYNVPKKLLEYTGDPVRFTRGDSVLTCKRLSALLDEGGEVSRGTCEGDVRFVRGDKVVTCEKAIYEAALARLTCHGNPTFKLGAVSGRGELLVYDLDKDEVVVDKPVGEIPSAEADRLTQQAQEKKKEKGAKP